MDKVVFDHSKLRGLIIEKFETLDAFCEAIGWSNVKCTRKLNNQSPIYRPEMLEMANLLEIPMEKFCDYFFTIKV